MPQYRQDSALDLKGVTKRYGKTRALQGIDLKVQNGELYGLIGPDGAGKSSLLRIAAGVLAQDAGQVQTLGRDIHSERSADAVKGRVGFMPQGLGQNLYPELSIDENIDFLGNLRLVHKSTLQRNKDRLLDMTRLTSFRSRAMKNLSGGMKQKLGLVCTLLHEPELLLLDEPTTGVDPVSRRDFWAILADLRREQGITVLVSTAYLDEASRFQRLTLLHKGQVMAKGSPEEIIASHASTKKEQQNKDEHTLESAFVALAGGQDADQAPAAQAPDVARDEEPAIEAQNLVKRFGDFTAVQDVSFSVAPGEIFGLLGANGAGKTTAIKMLVGLLPCTSGQGRILGRDPIEHPMQVKQRMGYMSQVFSLYDDLTVNENLQLYAGIYAVGRSQRKKRLQDVARDAGIAEMGNSLAGSLPTGLRQRLALACALLHEPRALFLDEPTSGVDPIGRRAFWRILFRLAEQQKVAMLVTTHYMSEAERCQRVGMMHAGRLIENDSPQALKDNVAQEHGTLLELDADAPLLALQALREAGADQPSLHGNHVRLFHPQGLEAEEELAAILKDKGARLQGLDERPLSMEDVFVVRMREQEARQ